MEACLPREFVEAGYADTESLGDAAETRIALSAKFEMNNKHYLQFLQEPHYICMDLSSWGILQYSETYPGTTSCIYDSDITDQKKINKGKVVLT